MRQKKGVKQTALPSLQPSGQMLGDVALGVEQRLRNHPFDRTDARYDDAPSSALA
ncbi:hypothetical protein Sbs19_38900 [Sphingobium sp. BS19]|nr:hypothetical protein Sbs19_38900 [Sphingobium sp. BS19]